MSHLPNRSHSPMSDKPKPPNHRPPLKAVQPTPKPLPWPPGIRKAVLDLNSVQRR
jgi:hypothetical protein